MAKTKFQFKTKGKCGTKPGTLLKRQIPIHNNYWNEGEPGFVEADTVAHCGDSMAGAFVWSLTLTDIYSGWTELRAIWGKSEANVIEKIKCIEKHLPFKLKGFDSDNGNEFLNHHLLRYFTERKEKVTFTRSRPYRKNDNAHVEQKNWSCVRQLLGYDRIENINAIDIMDDLYIHEWSLLNNYFLPTMKLEKKTRNGSQIKKIHSKPITPYERLLASNHLNNLQKQLLKDIYKTLNPFELRKSMESKLDKLFKLIKIRTDMKKRGNI